MQVNTIDPAKTAIIVVGMQNDFCRNRCSNGNTSCTSYGAEAS